MEKDPNKEILDNIKRGKILRCIVRRGDGVLCKAEEPTAES